MATILSCDFESGDFTGWTVTNPGLCSVVTSPVNSGTYAARLTSVYSPSSNGGIYRSLSSTYAVGATLYLRGYFRLASISLGADVTDWDYNIFGLSRSTDTTGSFFRLGTVGSYWNPRRIQIYNATTGQWSGIGTYDLSASVTYRVEMKLYIHDTAGSIEIRLYDAAGTLLDTVTMSGLNTYPGVGSPIARVDCGFNSGGARTYDFMVDDVAVSDTDWLGPVGAPPASPATDNKRRSIVGNGLLWLTVPPCPDGTIS